MSLPPDKFRSQINEARKRLQQLTREQRKINEEIGDLRELIRANANFLPEAEREQELYFLELFKYPTNITEAVRYALCMATLIGHKPTPVEIKSASEVFGFDFSEYSNPMASIHTVLKRMRDANPPEVNFDETTGTYWTEGLHQDIINPELLKSILDETYTEVITAMGGDAAKVATIAQRKTVEKMTKLAAKVTRQKD
jgi:hypothetical protein